MLQCTAKPVVPLGLESLHYEGFSPHLLMFLADFVSKGPSGPRGGGGSASHTCPPYTTAYPFLFSFSLLLMFLCSQEHEVMCRLNLAEGRFLSPLPAKSPGINACGISSAQGLFGCAGDDGVLECFDLRKRTSIGTLNAAAAAGAVSFCAALSSMRWL